jgi:hypothetical protein
MEETTDEFRTVPPVVGDKPDLLRVALAAWALHLAKRARVRIPSAPTPWGRSARMANLRQFNGR